MQESLAGLPQKHDRAIVPSSGLPSGDYWVSSTEPEYKYQVVRLVQGLDGPHAPQRQSEVVASVPGGVRPGRFQVAQMGSYALVKDFDQTNLHHGLHISLYFQPYLPQSGHTQTLLSTLDHVSKTGLAVVLTLEGHVSFWISTGQAIEVIPTQFMPATRRWVSLDLSLDAEGSLHYSLAPVGLFAEKPDPAIHGQGKLRNPVAHLERTSLLFGAGYASTPTAPPAATQATNFFNGRIDSPMIRSLGPGAQILARYDFSLQISSDTIVDVSGRGFHGTLINAPTRAVQGYDWDGTSVDWAKASHGYGAIHFHEDDLDDAGWATDISIRIPPDVRSGAYAVEVEATNGRAHDSITFFVRSSAETRAKVGAKVALVLSTFTYLAYGNERMYDQSKPSRMTAPNADFRIRKDEDFYKMERRTDLGLSTYDVHLDGSGVMYSSAKRPLLAVRPGYMHWALYRPREFSADLLMVGFLEHHHIPYDIVTDHDLHSMGVSCILPYSTVITGNHPEYPSLESLGAYTAFARRGGNLMYLGGNGFYWVSALDSARPHRLEVRRGDQGVRTYTVPGGERILSTNGQLGTLWRSRGRPANHLFGVGCCGEGTGPGVAYRRTGASQDPRFAWMFEGIGQEELLGEHGFGGGASGDEIDKFDVGNGSPVNAVVLATSVGHPEDFGIFPEDVGFPILHTLGTQTAEIRSDMVYYETAAGGGVFSVGSINWYCSLAWDGYNNNVATLTKNVLQGFLQKKWRI
ncbi:hypothetical protein A1O3_06930 [Capronia epimyces CBS 606.96]|uniref:N,N-dimethylformamidase beta subunit-like C-terminal domain-containing protein n=1 Tax=Capronia epimyces CBS 606.96 TaxID=1182542 RepID=W9XUF7_9EURO|nr:uncharacterized protein A1O3_06930 [Capronia epimyces CBS 606.96]EXJ80646.1 hypothetical protein A1O3_06930 [Capronia epimyces CBS 606.96]